MYGRRWPSHHRQPSRSAMPKQASLSPPDHLVTASALKLWIAGIVASDGAGRVIGAVTRKRIRHQGLWFDTRSPDFAPRVRAQMFWGAYEGAETRLIKTVLRGSSTVVELGSSLGVTSAHIAEVMAPGGHLICVEANPILLPGLRQRIPPRNPKVQIDIMHAAVTDHCGTDALTVGAHTVGSHLTAHPRLGESVLRVPAVSSWIFHRGSGLPSLVTVPVF
jgi:FkbM family methyltransferase